MCMAFEHEEPRERLPSPNDLENQQQTPELPQSAENQAVREVRKRSRGRRPHTPPPLPPELAVVDSPSPDSDQLLLRTLHSFRSGAYLDKDLILAALPNLPQWCRPRVRWYYRRLDRYTEDSILHLDLEPTLLTFLDSQLDIHTMAQAQAFCDREGVWEKDRHYRWALRTLALQTNPRRTSRERALTPQQQIQALSRGIQAFHDRVPPNPRSALPSIDGGSQPSAPDPTGY